MDIPTTYYKIALKKLKNERLRDWIQESKESTKERCDEEEIIKALKHHNQWQDLGNQHLAYIARIFGVEFNIRTSKRQKSWMKIKPSDFFPEIDLPHIEIKHGKRIFIGNLQEEGGWHYNLILFPEHGFQRLTEALHVY